MNILQTLQNILDIQVLVAVVEETVKNEREARFTFTWDQICVRVSPSKTRMVAALIQNKAGENCVFDHVSVVLASMHRLADKGFIKYDRPNMLQYSPCVLVETYDVIELKGTLASIAEAASL